MRRAMMSKKPNAAKRKLNLHQPTPADKARARKLRRIKAARFTIMYNGTAMSPALQAGDVLTIDRKRKAVSGDTVLAMVDDSAQTVVQYHQRGSQVTLEAPGAGLSLVVMSRRV